jgi:hypothetical protein
MTSPLFRYRNLGLSVPNSCFLFRRLRVLTLAQRPAVLTDKWFIICQTHDNTMQDNVYTTITPTFIAKITVDAILVFTFL